MDSAAAATGGGSPFLADRVKGYGLGRDPTGTIKLRGSFRAQLKLRLRLIGAALRQACGEHDLLALGRDGPLALHAPSTGLLAFQHCLTTAVLQQLGNDWQREFIDRAWTKGLVDAVGEVGIDPGYISPDREHELARAELRGIGEAIVQALTRAAAIAQARRLPRVKALRRLVKEFDKFKPRGVAFTNTAVVGAYNRAKIEVYRVAGVTHVGITPEMLPRKLMRDARKRPEPEEYVGEEDLEGVATAGDNDVCEECEDYSADSPYSSDEIELPLHPNCRCAVFPWFDMRRMPEFEETDAGEDVEFIQDPRGRFAGSRPGWGKAKEGGAFEFVSPNIEHLELKTAQKNLGSVRQRALRQASQEADPSEDPDNWVKAQLELGHADAAQRARHQLRELGCARRAVAIAEDEVLARTAGVVGVRVADRRHRMAVDEDGEAWEAMYTLELEADGNFKITGCSLLKAGQSV